MIPHVVLSQAKGESPCRLGGQVCARQPILVPVGRALAKLHASKSWPAPRRHPNCNHHTKNRFRASTQSTSFRSRSGSGCTVSQPLKEVLQCEVRVSWRWL